MSIKVLVLDADSSAGLEAIQSLGQSGCTIHAYSQRVRNARLQSRFIGRQLRLASYEDGGVSELIDVFRAEGYDLVVPSTEVSLLEMLEPEIPDDLYQRAVLPPRKSIRTALDKLATWNLALSLGMRVPASQLVCADSPPPEAFPVVLKPVSSKKSVSGVLRAFSVTIARNLDEWRRAMDSSYCGIPVLQQQFIIGKGVGVEMLFNRGKPAWTFMHERVHELPLTGGGSSYRVSLQRREDLINSATGLLSALEWHGVAMAEFRVTPSGEAYLMEINPRLWGSLALAIDSGVDFPLGLLCLSTGRPLPPQPEYRSGYFTRDIYRDFEWLKADLKADRLDPLLLTKPILPTLLQWLRPLRGKESWDFFCWSDLGVTLGELRFLIKDIWPSFIRVILGIKQRLGFDSSRG